MSHEHFKFPGGIPLAPDGQVRGQTTLVSTVSDRPEDEPLRRAYHVQPGEVAYLSYAKPLDRPALVEWVDDPRSALRLTAEEARAILIQLDNVHVDSTCFQHRVEPPLPRAEA